MFTVKREEPWVKELYDIINDLVQKSSNTKIVIKNGIVQLEPESNTCVENSKTSL